MFKKLLCMGLVVMGSAYGAENIPYCAQEAWGHVKPNASDCLKLARAFKTVPVYTTWSGSLFASSVPVPITAESTIGDMKGYLLAERVLIENKNLYATYSTWYESAKLANVIHFEAPLQDTEKVHDVIARYIHPPYINEIAFTFTLKSPQQ